MNTYSVVPQTFWDRHWFLKPAFIQYVRHAYHVGGYDILPNVGIDLDKDGLEWVRTFNLRDRRSGFEFRVIDPQDMHVLIGPHPSYDVVVEMYGPPVDYEDYKMWRLDHGKPIDRMRMGSD